MSCCCCCWCCCCCCCCCWWWWSLLYSAILSSRAESLQLWTGSPKCTLPTMRTCPGSTLSPGHSSLFVYFGQLRSTFVFSPFFIYIYKSTFVFPLPLYIFFFTARFEYQPKWCYCVHRYFYALLQCTSLPMYSAVWLLYYRAKILMWYMGW